MKLTLAVTSFKNLTTLWLFSHHYTPDYSYSAFSYIIGQLSHDWPLLHEELQNDYVIGGYYINGSAYVNGCYRPFLIEVSPKQ